MKWNYTIDQIYSLYEKSIRNELDDLKTGAVAMANAMAYTTPAYDKQGANSKQRAWSKFLDSIDFDKIQERSESSKTVGGMAKMLQVLGIKSKIPEKSGDSK